MRWGCNVVGGVGALVFATLVSTGPVEALFEPNIGRLTTYATLLGRGIACGVDTDIAAKRVGAWMDQVAPPGSKDQMIYLPIFAQGVEYHAKHQKDGLSPDSCKTLKKTFNTISWP